MKSLVVLLSTLLLLGTLRGQQSDKTYPGGPALNQAPDFSAWIVTCQYVAANGAPLSPSDVALIPYATMKVARTKDIRSVETISTSGQITTRWFLGSVESYMTSGLGFARYLTGPDRHYPGAYLDFSQGDFLDCLWVKPQFYMGTETIGGRQCLVFGQRKSQVGLDQPVSSSLTASDIVNRADIDLETRLPVKNQVGYLTYTYQFLPPPSGMLTLPPLMQARLNLEQRREKDLNKRPAAD